MHRESRVYPIQRANKYSIHNYIYVSKKNLVTDLASESQEEATTPFEPEIAYAPVIATPQASSYLDELSSSSKPCARAGWRPGRHSIPVYSESSNLEHTNQCQEPRKLQGVLGRWLSAVTADPGRPSPGLHYLSRQKLLGVLDLSGSSSAIPSEYYVYGSRDYNLSGRFQKGEAGWHASLGYRAAGPLSRRGPL